MASSYEMVDNALQGALAERLRVMRADGLSIDQMAEAFGSDGYSVSRETIRRWCDRAGVPTHRVPAPTPDAS